MKIEKPFPSPDLAAGFIEGVELFAPELGCTCLIEDLEVYTREAEIFGTSEMWVVRADVSPIDANRESKNPHVNISDFFDTTGWIKKDPKDYWPEGQYESFLSYVRSFEK